MKDFFKVLFAVLALCVFFMPLIWSMQYSPWYLFLFFVSWIPASALMVINKFIDENF
jgi:hypothetical protein